MRGEEKAIRVSAEVRRAVAGGRPVVALESTVLTHGLPRPRNREVGELLERVVREAGALPATVGVVEGVSRVGLQGEEIARLAAGGALKVSTRELPVAAARGADGGTTVAATCWLAHRAGVEVFATGGIGGVHRGPLTDVSADLAELARTPMVVVCAGPKAILDLPATREALESAGVLVAGWKTGEMPAFYTRRSGLEVDVRVDSAEEVTALWRAHRRLGIPGALLLCAPPPPEHALPAEEVEEAIRRALERAEAQGVRGKEVTPFLLQAMAEGSGGAALETNVALLRENARVAAAVACALAADAS